MVTKDIPRDGSKGREKNKEDVKSVKREQSDNTVDSNAFPTLEDKTWVIYVTCFTTMVCKLLPVFNIGLKR